MRIQTVRVSLNNPTFWNSLGLQKTNLTLHYVWSSNSWKSRTSNALLSLQMKRNKPNVLQTQRNPSAWLITMKPKRQVHVGPSKWRTHPRTPRPCKPACKPSKPNPRNVLAQQLKHRTQSNKTANAALSPRNWMNTQRTNSRSQTNVMQRLLSKLRLHPDSCVNSVQSNKKLDMLITRMGTCL